MSNNGIVEIHGKSYMTVAKRVELATADGLLSVTTEVLFQSPVVIRATVVTKKGTYSGISSVDQASGKQIERSNPYEVAETSAVGRALGFAGYGIIEGIASADEMVKSPSVQAQYEEQNPFIEEDQTDKAMCSVHEVPMLQGVSKKNNKPYLYHRDSTQGMCFGSGYKS